VGEKDTRDDVGIPDLDSRFWAAILRIRYYPYNPWHYMIRRNPPRAGGDRAEPWQLEEQNRHLSRWPITVAVELAQELRGADLVDLTWTESFREALMVLSRRIDLVKDRWEKQRLPSWTCSWVLDTIEQKLSEGHESYQAWLEERETTLTQRIPEVCVGRVGPIWRSEHEMLKATTEYSRRQARKLDGVLGADPYVAELRRLIGILDYGFQDEEEAARWLYDRDPLSRQFGPPIRWGWYRGRFADRPLHAREHVPGLAQAARRLGRKHGLNRAYDAHLCMYLLRGRFEPLPRQRRRKRTQEERDTYLLRLIDGYGYRVTAEAYNCRRTEEEVAALSAALGEPSEDALLDAIRNLATDRQSRHASDFFTPEDLHKIAHRVRQYYDAPHE